ncbi:MAG: ROK family protein [Propionibacteriaceae bacterium]|nr:ROK family protein [Propionibacteriaceae bacterium]
MGNVREAEASELLRLIRHGEATTRADLQNRLGLSRVTLGKRLDRLLHSGLIEEAGQNASTGGRPRTVFQLDPKCGVLLGADIGSSQTRLAMTDFSGKVLAREARQLDVAGGPGAVLPWVRRQLRRMVEKRGADAGGVLGVGVSVPGPVDPVSGRLVHPAIMPGWHGVDIAALLDDDFDGVPIAVGHDAQVAALGEYRTHWTNCESLLLLKASEGIAAAAVLGGDVHTGGMGVAGDFGHMRVPKGQQCRCGRFGCLESVASGWAMRKRLDEAGWTVNSSEELADLALRGDSLSIELVEQSAKIIGRSLGPVVAVLNPSVVVVAGAMANTRDVFLAPLREALQAMLPDDMTRLTVVPASLGADVGVIGAALLAQDLVVDASHLGSLIAPQ